MSTAEDSKTSGGQVDERPNDGMSYVTHHSGGTCNERPPRRWGNKIHGNIPYPTFLSYSLCMSVPIILNYENSTQKKRRKRTMKIASTALVAMLLLLLSGSHLSDAFLPHRLRLLPPLPQWKTSIMIIMDGPRDAMTTTTTTTNRRSMGFPVARFLAAFDDDEEEDDDDEDDDDEDDIDPLEPLANGIDSVSWLPSVKDTKTSTSSSSSSEEHPNAELIPLFPLGGIVYTPNSQHTLNIFEPRYREMYTDILMNGTKRFAVSMSHPTKSGTFAQMAVLFELEDLKEVSERTADQIKYICNHRVTGRVQLHRVLNPQDWETRSTYLRAEGTVIDDSGKSSSSSLSSEGDNNPSIESSSSASASIVVRDIENPVEQKLLKDAFAELVQLQHELEEDVRFTRASVLTLAVQPGSQKDGLWQTIKLWSSFIDQRLMSRQNELQQDFQEKLQNYLKKEKGLKGELPRYGDWWRRFGIIDAVVCVCVFLCFLSHHVRRPCCHDFFRIYIHQSTARLAFKIYPRNCKRR